MSVSVGRRLEGSELADRYAITEVVEAYCRYIDAALWEEFADLFTEDATYDIAPDPGFPAIPLPLRGRQAILEAMVAQRAVSGEQLVRQHLATNLLVRSKSAQEAEISSFLLALFVYPDKTIELRQAGIYVDSMRHCDDGVWRFASRLLLIGFAGMVQGAQHI